VALVLGGGFAYFKFFRGRSHRADLSPAVTAVLATVDGSRALQISTSITNTGTARMLFDDDSEQTLSLFCLDAQTWGSGRLEPYSDWTPDPALSWDQLTNGMGVTVYTSDMEPGESIRESYLIPIPVNSTWIAYKVELNVQASTRPWVRKKQAWQWRATTIILED
jgi:hypothetical protein